MLGEREGEMEPALGETEGLIEGLKLSDSDGLRDGLTLGLKLGDIEMLIDGLRLGDKL